MIMHRTDQPRTQGGAVSGDSGTRLRTDSVLMRTKRKKEKKERKVKYKQLRPPFSQFFQERIKSLLTFLEIRQRHGVHSSRGYVVSHFKSAQSDKNSALFLMPRKTYLYIPKYYKISRNLWMSTVQPI